MDSTLPGLPLETEDSPRGLARLARSGTFQVSASRFAFSIYRLIVNPFLRAISGGSTDRCRFEPSCSVYAEQAFANLPWSRAIPLVVKRLASCHPWNQGFTFDPLPHKGTP